MSIFAKIAKVQQNLKAPKGQRNSFGNYNYRSCEDILEAAKPHLAENGLVLFLSDAIKDISGRFYVEATATVIDIESGETYSVSASAREEESKKGMDASQVTGASSSYARKYALNGLFAIDDTKDSDATNTRGKDEEQPVKPKPKADKPKPEAKPEKSEEEINAMFAQTADGMIKSEGGVEFGVCSKCGGYIYQTRKKDGSVLTVRDMIILGLRGFNQPLCKNCYSEAVKAAKAK